MQLRPPSGALAQELPGCAGPMRQGGARTRAQQRKRRACSREANVIRMRHPHVRSAGARIGRATVQGGAHLLWLRAGEGALLLRIGCRRQASQDQAYWQPHEAAKAEPTPPAGDGAPNRRGQNRCMFFFGWSGHAGRQAASSAIASLIAK